MTLAQVIVPALQVSVFFTVVGFGLASSLEDLLFLFRRPWLLARSLLAMFIIVPVFAVAVTELFNLHSAVEIAVVALALSPIPPLLPLRAFKAGGTASYTFGLLFTAALLSVVLIPIGVTLAAGILGFAAQSVAPAIVKIVLVTVILPFLLGVAVNSLAPGFAARIVKPIFFSALAVLVVCALVVLYALMPAIISLIGDGTILVFVIFVAVGLVAGHLLGGPEESDRRVLALASAVRHPGVAIVIATANFPDQKLVVPAIFLYLLLNGVVSIPYLVWRRRGAQGGMSKE